MASVVTRIEQIYSPLTTIKNHISPIHAPRWSLPSCSLVRPERLRNWRSTSAEGQSNGASKIRLRPSHWSTGCPSVSSTKSRRRPQNGKEARLGSGGVCQARAGGLFEEEAIGAEHGEGFATFRPRGPLHVDVDYLNDRMKTRGLQRIRYSMRPDEAFGLIYSLDNVLTDTHALRWEAWRQLAVEEGRDLEELERAQRHIRSVGAERAVRQVLGWARHEGEVARLTARLASLYSLLFSQVKAPLDGVRPWLQALHRARVPCAVSSSLDRITLLAALERMGLSRYFRACVTEEDGMESIAHRFLSAAVKLDRAPSKCVVFEDDPRGVAAAHNCSMKAVALIGTHPAYELTQADLAVSNFSELSVINLRRLFAVRGLEFMDLEKQAEDKKPFKRKTRIDTF
eukprot:TRINITY_DN19124_c0_g2_i1.p1 TRINITY_DN19124_c0_g2~~TRINITY_DN19124_c0_g2_i1.p1  ORF type:complete len:399 (-),score=57.88 TRINITY_DN19124_c0_g2_i1:867-2063(-)